MQIRTSIRRALNKIFRVVRACDRPEPTNNPRRPVRPIGLEDLPPEVLEHILGYIADEWKDIRLPSVSQLSSPLPRGTSTPLKDMSTVNRRLRALCRPFLFRLLELDPSGPLPPPSILQHVKCMHVNLPRTSPSWVIDDDYLLHLHRLERVFWHGTRKQAQLSHLRLLLTLPALHALTLNNVWFQADATDLSTTTSRLRTLRIDFSQQVQNGKPALPEFVSAHLDCLDMILDTLRPGLESLTLSGYSAKLSSLAVAPWPSLRVFSLTRGAVIQDVPWAALLTQMPQLSSFTVALDRGETSTVIFPEAAAARDAPLSALRHFTISFPHPDDAVFASLPSDLRELSLRETPRYYIFRTRGRQRSELEPILSGQDVLRIFSVLSIANLCALELVYLEDEEEFRMLAVLSQSCPSLSLLELHRYPAEPSAKDAFYDGTLSIPVDALADALAAFSALRVLKLNLCVTQSDTARLNGTLPLDYWDRLADLLESHAYAVTLRVPWIRTLALLAWSRCGMHWDTWSLYPGGAVEGPQLVHDDIYHESFEGCKERAFF